MTHLALCSHTAVPLHILRSHDFLPFPVFLTSPSSSSMALQQFYLPEKHSLASELGQEQLCSVAFTPSACLAILELPDSSLSPLSPNCGHPKEQRPCFIIFTLAPGTQEMLTNICSVKMSNSLNSASEKTPAQTVRAVFKVTELIHRGLESTSPVWNSHVILNTPPYCFKHKAHSGSQKGLCSVLMNPGASVQSTLACEIPGFPNLLICDAFRPGEKTQQIEGGILHLQKQAPIALEFTPNQVTHFVSRLSTSQLKCVVQAQLASHTHEPDVWPASVHEDYRHTHTKSQKERMSSYSAVLRTSLTFMHLS